MGEHARRAVILALWIIFAGIGVAASIRFVITTVFQSGEGCDMNHAARRRAISSGHECPIANCITNVPSGIYMCPRHWRMVPRPLQAAVYASFRAKGGISENHYEAKRVVEAAEVGRNTTGLPAGTKALTLWQPWASLIMIGAKPYEFRKWNFTDKPHLAKLVGRRTVIHAGARPIKKGELEDIMERIEEGESALIADVAKPFIERVLDGELKLPMASALGTAVFGQPQRSYDLFKHIVADSDRLDQQMYAWPGWRRTGVRRANPLRRRAQGFWNWS